MNKQIEGKILSIPTRYDWSLLTIIFLLTILLFLGPNQREILYNGERYKDTYIMHLNDNNFIWQNAEDYLCSDGVVISDFRNNKYGVGENRTYFSTYHMSEGHTTDYGVCLIKGGNRYFLN